MAHGLAFFRARELIDKANGAFSLLDATRDGGEKVAADSIQETLKVVIENQIKIAETLDRIKIEFDKFAEGIGKILRPPPSGLDARPLWA